MRTSLAKFFKYTSLAVIVVVGTTNLNLSIAGGDPNIKDKVYQNKTNIKQHNHKDIYKSQSKNKSLEKSKSTSNSKNSNKNKESTVSGFSAVEDEPLIVDLSSVIDSDGMGQVSVQWQISETGSNWKNISKEVSQSFTPRELHVGKKLRVVISYVDGQGNLETLISPPSSTVKNVNDKPTGSARLIGSPVEDSALVVDTSSISDEDGIGGFEISWQRSSSQSDWEAFPSDDSEVLRLQQEHVNYSFRAVVTYIDSHGTREVLYTSPSESIDNLDDPVQGDVTIDGLPKEGSILKAISNSLSDEDGIASINISWEKSKDGRNWIALNSVSGPSLDLTQSLVGYQIRTRVAVVDNFGIETNLYSLATRTVENVNDKPSGKIIIRRVGQ